MAKSQSLREAVVALQKLSETIFSDYHVGLMAFRNPLVPLFGSLRKKRKPYRVEAFGEAQTYIQNGAEHYFVLADWAPPDHIIWDMSETLHWLTNDMLQFDHLSELYFSEPKKDPRRIYAEQRGEAVMIRALHLGVWLGVLLQSLDENLFIQVSSGSQAAQRRAQEISNAANGAFVGALKKLDMVKDKQALGELLKQLPICTPAPLCLSAPRAEAESINGVLLTADLAKQLRAAIARIQAQAMAASHAAT